MDNDRIELGPPGPFVAGVMAGIKAADAIDVPGETTFDQRSAFFWLHVGTSMARAELLDTESQIQYVEGAKTRAPSRELAEPGLAALIDRGLTFSEAVTAFAAEEGEEEPTT